MGCQSTDLCTENYLSKLCLMCADCEIFFLTCPNSTLFFFAFHASRCPSLAPNLAVERQKEYTDQLNPMVKISFELHDDSKLKSPKQDQNHIFQIAACPFVWCQNKTAIEIYLFQLAVFV